MKTQIKFLAIVLSILMFQTIAQAIEKSEELQVTETPTAIEIQQPENKSTNTTSKIETTQAITNQINTKLFDPLKYTLGQDDTIEITVMRHPEFSGVYPINKEGKLQYKFVGDIEVVGLTKQQLEQKIKDVISAYLISPEVNVTVTEYKSKVIYVLGEVGTPGKYYMQSETIPVREAIFQAGLPTQAAAMRKCQLITPDRHGRPKIKTVDVYSILYGGNLKKNINMYPGDVLYVPSTVMAKIIRVINPVASTVGLASSGPSSASAGKTAVETLAK